jgi:acetyl esterase/lipase
MAQHPNPRTSSRQHLVRRFGAVGVGLAMTPATLHARQATPEAEAVSTKSGIVYGETGGRPLLLDVHSLPPSGTPRPAVMLFHGGGWTYGIGGPAHMTLPAHNFAEAGYVAFNVAYRLTGDPAGAFQWPDQLDDVQRAVRWVRANAGEYGVDPERIGAYGHSAGAHLAALLATCDTRDDRDAELAGLSSRVNCTITLAGHMDLLIPYPEEFDRESLVALLGTTPEEDPDAYRDASPITWVDDASSPFLIIHGGADDMNSPEHARTMTAALQAAGVEVVYAEFPEANHFTAADWPVAGPWALTFLERHLHPST